jgi:hypothetical protein
MPPIWKERKPQRAPHVWTLAVELASYDSSTPAAMEAIERANQLTCRDCLGFGHSKSTCPTAAKLDAHRKTNKLLCSVISRYRTE